MRMDSTGGGILVSFFRLGYVGQIRLRATHTTPITTSTTVVAFNL